MFVQGIWKEEEGLWEDGGAVDKAGGTGNWQGWEQRDCSWNLQAQLSRS